MAEKVTAKINATLHAGSEPMPPLTPVKMDREDAERLIAVFGGEIEASRSGKAPAKSEKVAQIAAAERAVTEAADALDVAIREGDGVAAGDIDATAKAAASIAAAEKALADAEAALAALKA